MCSGVRAFYILPFPLLCLTRVTSWSKAVLRKGIIRPLAGMFVSRKNKEHGGGGAAALMHAWRAHHSMYLPISASPFSPPPSLAPSVSPSFSPSSSSNAHSPARPFRSRLAQVIRARVHINGVFMSRIHRCGGVRCRTNARARGWKNARARGWKLQAPFFLRSYH